MFADTYNDIVFGGEDFATQCTDERFIYIVYQHVFSQVVFPRDSNTTDDTGNTTNYLFSEMHM